MTNTKVAILGAGLAGLNAARLLHRAGIDFILLEAGGRPGGRILSVDAAGAPAADGFDLGPSWFWPDRQRAIAGLVRELGLESFPQNAQGYVVFERMSREAPHRLSGLRDDQQSQRLAGGSAALVDALVKALPTDRLRYGAKVVAMTLTAGGVELSVRTGDVVKETLTAEQVIVALPPRLLAATIPLDPAPYDSVLHLWNSTPTWMAPHAKVFALYDRPFWREAGFSGTAQSLVGPMAEIHDATTCSGQAALFGFVGVGAGQRAAMGEEALKAACIQQFARIFGDDAANPRATLLKDWASDSLTATPADAAPTAHAAGQAREWIAGPWQARLAFAGSETSAIEAGFLSGAVEASVEAAKLVRQRLEGMLAG
ncbi:FAD-dependent oxidoreductase [Phaeobacter gallaeciensis]|uniref:FAD-dependent oxidoreductase n=1 Tax=Phaeobacter gallaeciensis TaxID=60890 RepID=A0ABD4XFX4_9RHOB|nr:FAD-dependent oxidoreductase [Phaeobacter gallaeciensis]MDE4147138.1 FAD-dependent oxidoreductase [Phaeobacter gallaeciensis]MDE4159773.1 FAD-dependent oxidoreductase [Phaeobacter gallaeciensis]MDE4163991.1 FAD-dependent oxidoreductase [Phaeobacter gallaeciensis]MDE4168226.1 FAD-dependent oxidoreductase [Phaeobacter gallaeciensis]MDE4172453.1 FAD-dependent oxidoreductase [Phaeobacter gallaeciensis]